MGASSSIHLYNSTSEDIYVMVAPNADWAIVHVVVRVETLLDSLSTLISDAGGTAVTTIGTIKTTWTTLSCFGGAAFRIAFAAADLGTTNHFFLTRDMT
jgi:hypothetical protein